MPTVAFKAENIVPDGWDQDEFDYPIYLCF